MFRFSRRAVCKQLNNRENEFYERIEQRHPDMLRFLPRLVTDVKCVRTSTRKRYRMVDLNFANEVNDLQVHWCFECDIFQRA